MEFLSPVRAAFSQPWQHNLLPCPFRSCWRLCLPLPAACSAPPTPTHSQFRSRVTSSEKLSSHKMRACLLPPLFSLSNSSIPFSLSRALISLLTSLSPPGHFSSCHRDSALFISASRGWHKEILPFLLPLLLNKWHYFRNVIRPINYLLGHILLNKVKET